MVFELHYHAQSPPSQFVWMTLKELGLDFKLIEVDLFSGEQKKSGFLSLNPLGQVPVLKDGDFILTDSRAIAMYLCSKYEPADKKNKLYPTDLKKRAKVDSTMFADLDNFAKIHEYTNAYDVFMGTGTGPIDKLLPKAKSALSHMETLLGDSDYLGAVHLTIVDFFALHCTGMLEMCGFNGWSEFPAVDKWRNTMSKLPYYDECYAKPFDMNTQYYNAQNKKLRENMSQ